jgi:hypothetical protein
MAREMRGTRQGDRRCGKRERKRMMVRGKKRKKT